ncbi:hypothetical protein ACER0A_000695 [Haloimpatiens sp. FM7315]|uniref:hypothetical protein n=1 Tax=Haloimpatiens sp. FM7315 TaxID=3298609 RepID=UPI0035A38494
MVTFIIIISIILAIISAVLIVKNFLVKYSGSNNGFKNVIFLGLIVVALMCSLSGTWEGISTKNRMDYLANHKEIPKKEIESLKNEIEWGKRNIKNIV